jgi:hypothetical protein
MPPKDTPAELETAGRVTEEMITLYGSMPVEQLSAEDALRVDPRPASALSHMW